MKDVVFKKGIRLDKFLKESRLIARRTIAKEAAEKGFVFVNGKEAKPSYILKDKDVIDVYLKNGKKSFYISIKEEDGKIHILASEISVDNKGIPQC